MTDLIVQFSGQVHYTTEPGNPDGPMTADLPLNLPEEPKHVVLLRFAIESLMAAYARHCPDGFEAGIEALTAGDMTG